ncbi:phage tail family protein [Pullulanibacillus sp. KACC 23026]|uniref:distal tail protein Dit n=1 Tax=Pullulanibacillus sp. KACC 23026 TaxID=3028315 RepID=UPI0023B025AC|nr:distal tail protein Dit [Pullulanibacillus sp. KACC 23026]WEG14158.1 phage tail family protein [Pullulanibacillus sp. KACC 23026]
MTFNFCGMDSYQDLKLIVNDIRIPLAGTLTENVQEIPGMVGNLFQGVSISSKPIEIDATLIADSDRDRMMKAYTLADLFLQYTDDEYPMIFSPISEYTYYGHFTNLPALQRIAQNETSGALTLLFTCSDPKAYGEQQEIQITNNPFTVTPNGTTDCYPIFTCLPHADVTKIAVTDQDGNYAYVGSEVDPDTGGTAIDNEPQILHDYCNDLSPWQTITQSNLTFNLENGKIGGSMRSVVDVFKVGLTSDGKDDYGSNVSGHWHGPVIQRWLPQACNDYRIRARMKNAQFYPRAQGKIELYLLDANGKRIGKIMLKDNGSSEEVYAQAQIGDTTDYHTLYYGAGTVKKGASKKLKIKNETNPKGKTKTAQKWKTITETESFSTDTFTNFYGYIEIQKIGNKYRFEIMKLNDDVNPAWSKPITGTWTDNTNHYGSALAGIALYVAKYDIKEDQVTPVVNYQNNTLDLCDVTVNNIINGGNSASSTTPTIAKDGDEIKINCEDHNLYKNGAFFNDKLYIGSNFPVMVGGVEQTFAFEPDLDSADWYVSYRPTRP